MKKTLFVFAIFVIILSLSLLAGCNRIEDDNADIVSNSTVENEENVRVDYPPVPPETITLENGTGIISIGMTRDEVIQQFEEWNLNYTLDYTPEISKFSRIDVNYGTYQYNFDRDGILDEVFLGMTSKGLKYGDSIEKMKNLYGTDYVVSFTQVFDGGELRYLNYDSVDSGATLKIETLYIDGKDESAATVMNMWVCAL